MKQKTQKFYTFLKRAGITPTPDIPDFKLPFVPWPHQARRLNSLTLNDRFGLFDDCATGKTFVMQSAVIIHKSRGYKSMVIMPPVLLEQFQESFRDTFEGVDDYLSIHQLAALPPRKGKTAAQQRNALIAQWQSSGFPDVLLLSYQMFIKDFVQEQLVNNYQIFIADEAHNLRNWGSKASKYLYGLVNSSRESALILSTATPMYRDPLDAYGLIKLINPEAYSSENNFKKLHVVYKKLFIKLATPIRGRDYRVVYEVQGFNQLEKVQANLYKHAARITKDKVLPLAKPTIIEIPVELSKVHLRYYQEFARARFAELPDGDIIEALNAQALRQELLRIITSAHDYSPSITEKTNNILQAVDTVLDGMNLGPENKMVLFANSTVSVRMLAKYYAKHNPALMYGPSDSKKGLRQFLQDDSCLMNIANPHSAGAGLNLQSVCSTFCFVEPTTIPGLFKQASERFPRAGQKNPVIGYVIKPLHTLSAFMTDTMVGRENSILRASPERGSFLQEIEGRV